MNKSESASFPVKVIIAPESSSLLVLMSSRAVVRGEKLKNANWEIICQKQSEPLEWSALLKESETEQKVILEELVSIICKKYN